MLTWLQITAYTNLGMDVFLTQISHFKAWTFTKFEKKKADRDNPY